MEGVSFQIKTKSKTMEKGISMTDNVFSLLDEHWIPVSYLDGHPAEISLREIFLDAPKIKELSGDCLLYTSDAADE